MDLILNTIYFTKIHLQEDINPWINFYYNINIF